MSRRLQQQQQQRHIVASDFTSVHNRVNYVSLSIVAFDNVIVFIIVMINALKF